VFGYFNLCDFLLAKDQLNVCEGVKMSLSCSLSLHLLFNGPFYLLKLRRFLFLDFFVRLPLNWV